VLLYVCLVCALPTSADVFACIANGWSELCTNPCVAAPQLNHGSFPSKCSGSGVNKDDTCSGQCDKGWKASHPAPTATCTSAGWVVKGTCEVRHVLLCVGLMHFTSALSCEMG
jgi:hypothetical protein